MNLIKIVITPLFCSCNGLLEICYEKGFEVALGTVLKDPFRSEIFDFALSIAVIHHLRSPQRRAQAIKEMLRVMKSGAVGLIFVWAFEENKSVRRHKLTVLDGNEQDVLVPWSMSEFPVKKEELKEEEEKEPELKRIKKDESAFQRYYHLFKKGELDELVKEAGGTILESGYDRDNWYIKFQK